jgi:outer membrane protein assembly factor BamB
MKHRGKIVSSIVIGVILLIFFFRAHTPQQLIKPEVEAQTTNTDWPQLQHDPQHTGRTTVSVAPNYKVAWAWFDRNHVKTNFTSSPGNNITDGLNLSQFTVLFSQQMQPIVADNKVFFGDMDGKFYIVNAATGTTLWEYASGGPILGSAAYDANIVVFGSMDGKLYALNTTDGTLRWQFQTDAGISSSPVIANITVFVGSRDGKFYALDLLKGTKKWEYTTRVEPVNANSPFNKAPIVMPAVLSIDEATVMFGAENMYFYGLNALNGQEKWNPKKLVGQSFLYGWPVVTQDKVIVRTMSSLPGAEFVMEDVLDTLPNSVSWSQEKTAISSWITQNPHQKTMYVFNVNTGQEPYQVAMGRVTGNNYTAHPPVIDSQGKPLTYWRSRDAYFFIDGSCYGTKYCPDFSAMDLATGDRINLNNPSGDRLAPELDNGFQPTIGGNYVYFANHFRGTHAINLTTGALTRMTTQSAKWDCGNFRAWGFQIIYFGNDNEPDCTYTNARAPSKYQNSVGFVGISIATVNGTPMLFVNEGDAGGIVAIVKQ